MNIDNTLCMQCGQCDQMCTQGAIEVIGPSLRKIDEEKCVECGKCMMVCPAGAIRDDKD